jgi:hypothetical protein
MMQENPTSGLAHTLATKRTLLHQAVGLGAFLGVCAIARFSPFHEPEPITGALILLGTAALTGLLVCCWATTHQATGFADELILQGHSGEGQRTPIDRALCARIAAIESAQSRHRLAEDLRWRLRLAAGTTRPSPGYIRACAFPPLGSVGRRVFLEEEAMLTQIVDRIEQSPVDPRALVILWRVVTRPPELESTWEGRTASEQATAEELRASLRRACVFARFDDLAGKPARSERRRDRRRRRAASHTR